MSKIYFVFRAFFIVFCTIIIGQEVTYSETLKVWTIEREPFSYKDEDWNWTWFSIDLWTSIAQENDFSFEFIPYTDFWEMILDTRYKENDLSVANISITAEREKVLDFSSPIYDSGLNIWSLWENSEIFSFYSQYSQNIILCLKILVSILVVITHYFFILNIIKWHISIVSYPKEIFLILFEVLRQIKKVLGIKIIFITSLVIGIFIVSFISQKFTLILNDIDTKKMAFTDTISYKNLDSTKIWVTDGSVWQSFLYTRGITPKWYSELWSIYNDILTKKIDYIITDDPILRYKVKNDPRFQLRWKTFNPDKYALLFPQYNDRSNAEFIKQINVSILRIKEEWKYDLIYNKYFQ